MLRVLIWGAGSEYDKTINLLKCYEKIGQFEIVGVTARDELYYEIDGYPFYYIRELDRVSYDVIIIAAAGIAYDEIRKTAIQMGMDEDNMVKASILSYPGFEIKKYLELVKSHITLLSNNCWAGITYHALGLKFRSPFINMFVSVKDYLRLLSDLESYMKLDLKFDARNYEPNLKKNYPVCLLGDIKLNFNHYSSMEEVERKWYQRRERINWNNLFVEMDTEIWENAKIFDSLMFDKKICFIPFEEKSASSYKINLASKIYGVVVAPLWQVAQGISSGMYREFDLIDLLLDRKIAKRAQPAG